MIRGQARLAYFGNFLSGSLGGRSVCEDLADRLENRGAAVVRASTHLHPVRRLVDMLRTAANARSRYDVAFVDVYSGRGFIWAECVTALLRLLRKPVVLILHGGALPEFGRRHPARVHRLLRSARRVVAPSRYLAEAMRPFHDDILILPNTVDVATYRGRVRTAAAPRFLWLRSFHAIYNPSMAARVLAAVSVRWPDARLTMAGPDKRDGSRDAFLAEAKRLGVLDRIELAGNVAKVDIPALLDRHDILLNTSNADNTPVSLIEAMAAGLCIVTTNVGGITALCRDGETALLVGPDDAEAMAQACLALLNDPARARAMSAAALAEAGSYDGEPVLKRWEQLLSSVTN